MPDGRFAPSPTGLLHLGSARTALAAWLAARADGSRFVLRIEDLDRPRVVPGAAEAIVEDLRWLGLDWDEGLLSQSERLPHYEAALERLAAASLTYLCYCSRADIARSASAPHPGEKGPRYPGTCRPAVPISVPLPSSAAAEERLGEGTHPVGQDGAHGRRHPHLASPASERGTPIGARVAGGRGTKSTRFRVEPGQVCFDDALVGRYCQDVAAVIGDFVLRRADGIFAYQLAVVVDDIAMGVQQVVRGDDLLASTPRQLLLYQALGAQPPAFAHLPLVLGPDGQRFSKRHGATTIRDFRDAGMQPRQMVGALGASLGLCELGQTASPHDLVAAFDWSRIRREPDLTLWPALSRWMPS